MDSKTVAMVDKKITARQITVKDLPKVAAAVAPFIDEFDNVVKQGGLTNQALIKLCLNHTDDFVRLCVVMTDADKDWLNNLSPSDFYKLVEQVITISHDFFLTQLEPSLIAIIQSLNNQVLSMILTRMITGLSQQSSDLSAMGMADKTS